MQRVAIGRALVRSPAIYLMDEPLSSLDAKLRADLRVELKHIQADLGATILYVTHDQIEAMTLAARIGVIDQGRLVQVGTPRQIYEEPVNAYVATRLGSPGINLLPRALFPDTAAPPAASVIGARTEHIRIRKSRERLSDRQGYLDRASRRSESPACGGAASDDLVTLADPDIGSRGRRRGDDEIRAAAFLRRRRQPGRSVMRRTGMERWTRRCNAS